MVGLLVDCIADQRHSTSLHLVCLLPPSIRRRRQPPREAKCSLYVRAQSILTRRERRAMPRVNVVSPTARTDYSAAALRSAPPLASPIPRHRLNSPSARTTVAPPPPAVITDRPSRQLSQATRTRCGGNQTIVAEAPIISSSHRRETNAARTQQKKIQ